MPVWTKHYQDIQNGLPPNTSNVAVPPNAKTLYYADTAAYPSRNLMDVNLYKKHLMYLTPWNVFGFDWVNIL
jgi:hypothetical protein